VPKQYRRHQRALLHMIETRMEIPLVTGIEVGCFKGETSRILLDEIEGLTLHMVDPWKEWPEDHTFYKTGMGKRTQAEWDEVYQEALSAVQNRPAVVHRHTSQEAESGFQKATVELVFIDGGHTYEDVIEDIRLWLPKVKKGGLICGHDYGGRYEGVRRAVLKCFGGRELIVHHRARMWGYVIR